MEKGTREIRAIDKTVLQDRGWQRRRARAVMPSETAREPLALKQDRSYADCYRWSLTDAERRQQMENRSPVLRALRVLSCGLFVEAHGHWWERSSLPEGILIYCTGGKGYYRQGGREYEIRPGDLLYCPPQTHHRYWADADNPWSIYWVHLAGELLPHYESLLGLVERGPVREIGLHDDIIADFTRLITHPALSPAGDSEWFCIQANVVAILGRIAALPHNILDFSAAFGPIKKAIALMKESVEQRFDLRRFAREAGYGCRHFSRQFCRVTGLPPGDWFIRQKMHHACELLTLPNIRVKGVAARLGYTDPLYFSRIFKKTVGLSPERYRQDLRSVHGPEANAGLLTSSARRRRSHAQPPRARRILV